MEDLTLKSAIDRSVNFITPFGDSFVETRFVQRYEENIIIYLSSLNGCDRACRMCHLTQSGQVSMTPMTLADYDRALVSTMRYVRENIPTTSVKYVHYNFMARGDALSNPHLIEGYKKLFRKMTVLAKQIGAEPKIKISTIFPTESPADIFEGALEHWVRRLFQFPVDIEIYYSLYSLRPEFRKRWLPKSLSPDRIGAMFQGSKGGLRLHHALIAGQNDGQDDIDLIHAWLSKWNIRARMNIVAYNPHSPSTGVESDPATTLRYIEQMKRSDHIIDVHPITRVGKDVHASCGAFYNAG